MANLVCESHVSLLNVTRTTTSTSYTFTVDRNPIWRYDAGVFDGVSGIYVEAVLKAISGDTAYMNLSTLASSAVTGSEVSTTSTTFVAVRSGDIVANLTDDTDYHTEWKKTGTAGTASFNVFRVIISQSGAVTKTETVIEMASDNNVNAMYEVPLADQYVFLYTAAEYNGTVVFFWEADLHCNAAGDTTYSQLYDVTAAAAVASSEVTHTGDTTTTRKRSSAITLVDGHEYMPQAKGGSTADDLVAGKLIIQQSGTPTTTTKYNTVLNTLTSATGTSYAYQNRLLDFDASGYSGDTKSFEYEATLKVSVGAETGTYNLNNDTDATELAVCTTTSTTFARSRDTSVTMPSDDNNSLNSGRKVSVGVETVSVARSFLIAKLTWSVSATAVKDLIQVGIIPFAR